jgi:hypothetical protein
MHVVLALCSSLFRNSQLTVDHSLMDFCPDSLVAFMLRCKSLQAFDQCSHAAVLCSAAQADELRSSISDDAAAAMEHVQSIQQQLQALQGLREKLANLGNERL